MGNIIRLALMAGTGAGIAGIKRAGVRLAALLAMAVIVAMLLAAALGCFGFAAFAAILPHLGPVWSAAVVGLGFALAALILFLACRYACRQPRRSAAAGAAGAYAGPLGAMAGLEGLANLRPVLERNAVPILLAAFVAGVVASRRR